MKSCKILQANILNNGNILDVNHQKSVFVFIQSIQEVYKLYMIVVIIVLEFGCCGIYSTSQSAWVWDCGIRRFLFLLTRNSRYLSSVLGRIFGYSVVHEGTA